MGLFLCYMWFTTGPTGLRGMKVGVGDYNEPNANYISNILDMHSKPKGALSRKILMRPAY